MAGKLLIDTDIGTDVDDAFALLFALGSPEYELAAVTLVHGNLDVRAGIAAKILALAGRPDIPIYKGWSETLSGGRSLVWAGHEDQVRALTPDDASLPRPRVEEGAVDKLIELAADLGPELTVAAIGPWTNVAAALRQARDIMSGIKAFYLMGATFNGFGREAAGIEHNVRVDPEAAQEVLKSGLPTKVVGLNVTRQVKLTTAHVQSIKGRSPLGDFAAAMAEHYFRLCGRSWTYMHDPLAIAAACQPSIIRTVSCSAEVICEGEDDGKTVFLMDGEPKVEVATEVDSTAFERLFLSRVQSVI